MANPYIEFFNFYRRYKMREADMQEWSQAHLDTIGGAFEGAFGKCVFGGFHYDSSTGMNVSVSQGIAAGPTGYFMAVTGEQAVTLVAPTGAGHGVRHLVVARPLLVPQDYITNPTVPFQTVPLKTGYYTQIACVTGTPAAAPDYPFSSTGPNDVVLFGVSLPPAATGFDSTAIDLSVRDILGKNSNFQQNAGRYDNRCRPFRASPVLVGIKPSQLSGKFPQQFLYVNKVTAAIYPKDGSGKFTNLDSFYNMSTGAVTGGDASTPAFTPTIPTAGNFIVARLGLSTNNQVIISYGTQGTLAQCLAAIANQTTAGAGSINTPASVFPIAYVIVGSVDGAAVTSLDVIDARSQLSFGGPDSTGAANVVNISANYTVAAGDGLIRGNAASGGFAATFPDATVNLGVAYELKKIDSSANAITALFTGGQTADGVSGYVLSERYQFVVFRASGASGFDIVGAG